MECCLGKRSICTNASILLNVAVSDDLSTVAGALAGDADVGVSVVVLTWSVMVSMVSVGRSIAPPVNDAFVECDTNPEDIVISTQSF